jgi:hypothetical protein
MTGVSNRASKPHGKKKWWGSSWWTKERLGLGMLIIAAIGTIALPIIYTWRKNAEPKGDNTATNTTSSGVVQGGNVGNFTVNNYPQGASLSPSPTSTGTPPPTPSPSPTPLSNVQRQEPKAIATPPPVVQESCAKSNYSDTLQKGRSYADNDIGFEVAHGGMAMNDPILILKMPGKGQMESIFLHKRYNSNVRNDGCLYFFSAEEAPGLTIKFTFTGTGKRNITKPPER